MTTFAQISINEIQMLHQKKASALEIIIYQVIASHIHSKKRNNAYPSLKRIRTLLGGTPTIQSITRAITSLQRKGLLTKAKIRSKNRFVLIHRPMEAVKNASKHAKQFLRRFTPKNLASLSAKSKYGDDNQDCSRPYTTKQSRSETKPNRQHKRTNQVEKSKSLYEERGEQVWYKLAPCGGNDAFQIEKITDNEKVMFMEWIRNSDTELKKWINRYYSAQMESMK